MHKRLRQPGCQTNYAEAEVFGERIEIPVVVQQIKYALFVPEMCYQLRFPRPSPNQPGLVVVSHPRQSRCSPSAHADFFADIKAAKIEPCVQNIYLIKIYLYQ
jgi:hypothetical protein